jgi:hypothetical protein
MYWALGMYSEAVLVSVAMLSFGGIGTPCEQKEQKIRAFR